MTKYCFHSDTVKEVVQECRERVNISELETLVLAREGKDAAPSPGEELHNQPAAQQLEIHVSSVWFTDRSVIGVYVFWSGFEIVICNSISAIFFQF